VESAHGPYRWSVPSLVKRSSLTFASFTNSHAAFTIASRAHLQKAIDSGGFLVEPHVGRFGMLECAASDLYTQCGMTRLICVSRIEDFLVPHLSNKNCPKWGLPYDEFVKQTHALEQNELKGAWQGSLLEVETRMPRGLWSKNLYERPDPSILELIPREARSILSVGAGWGSTEEFLAQQGRQVVGVPVDTVFADCLRRRGVETVEGPIEAAIAALQSRRFDVVLLLDVMHLLADPVHWLRLIQPLLNREGFIVATTPRTFDPLRLIWCFRGEVNAVFPKTYSDSQVQKVNRRRLASWFKAAGLAADIHATCNTPTRIACQKRMPAACAELFADRFLVKAKLASKTGNLPLDAA